MNRSRRIAGGSLVILVALLGWVGHRVWLSLSGGSASEIDTEVDIDEKTGNPAIGRGVQSRELDPALRHAGWTSDDLEPELLDDVLDRPVSGMDVALLDLQGNEALVPWLGSLVAEDEFGQAIAECRAEYERRQEGRCHWYQDVVLRRSLAGEASVVAVRPRTTPLLLASDQSTEPIGPECQAWARCVAAAWKGRPGLFPRGADDYMTTGKDGSDYIALRTSVHHLEAYGVDASDYRTRYRDQVSRLEKKTQKREQAYLEAEEAGTRSKEAREGLYHNLLQERGWIKDHEVFLQYLQDREL